MLFSREKFTQGLLDAKKYEDKEGSPDAPSSIVQLSNSDKPIRSTIVVSSTSSSTPLAETSNDTASCQTSSTQLRSGNCKE